MVSPGRGQGGHQANPPGPQPPQPQQFPLEQYLSRLIDRYVFIEAVFISDRDGVLVTAALEQGAVFRDELRQPTSLGTFLNVYSTGVEQAAKLFPSQSGGRCKASVSFHRKGQAIVQRVAPDFVVTFIAGRHANIGVLLELCDEVVKVLEPANRIMREVAMES
eukprot:Clim_evm35s7 gene=Clim_evmTU35s7